LESSEILLRGRFHERENALKSRGYSPLEQQGILLLDIPSSLIGRTANQDIRDRA
jgi:hypothetical protein